MLRLRGRGDREPTLNTTCSLLGLNSGAVHGKSVAVTTGRLVRREPRARERLVRSVEKLLRNALRDDEGPLTLRQIQERLGRTVPLRSVRAAVGELTETAYAVESPTKGIMWCPPVKKKPWRDEDLVRLA